MLTKQLVSAEYINGKMLALGQGRLVLNYGVNRKMLSWGGLSGGGAI